MSNVSRPFHVAAGLWALSALSAEAAVVMP